MKTLGPPRQALAMALSGLAGYVDAVGFLSADQYFVSFMSGNTTRLATDLITKGAGALIPALLILGFIIGVASGSVVAYKAGRWRKPAVLSLVTVLLTLAAALAMADLPEGMMAMLVLAMGAINNTMQRDETPVALTYLTGAVVRLGQGLGALVTGRRTSGTLPYLMLWLSLASGAAFGAIMFLDIGATCLVVAVAASALLTLAGWWIGRLSPQS
jgi:uncharacterized membrane protein YoaK (UPF0700 family)